MHGIYPDVGEKMYLILRFNNYSPVEEAPKHCPLPQIMDIHYFGILCAFSIIHLSPFSINRNYIFLWELPLPLAQESLWFRIMTPPILTPQN